MTNFKTESKKIEDAFIAAKNGKCAVIDTNEWELVCDMTYQAGLKLRGLMHWPYEGTEPCDIDQHGNPETIQVEGNTVTFYYF